VVRTRGFHLRSRGSIPREGAHFAQLLSPIPYPPSLMSHLYRFSINPASSLPTSLQSYAHVSWIHYIVYPDGSIYAEMPDGCLMVDAPYPYRAA
jgi:hypothetical protein